MSYLANTQKNSRAMGILFTLTHCEFPENRNNVTVEIGTMFNELEGLSTLIIADAVRNLDRAGRVLSVDLEHSHTEICQSIIERYDPSLLDGNLISWEVGYSLDVLRTAI